MGVRSRELSSSESFFFDLLLVERGLDGISDGWESRPRPKSLPNSPGRESVDRGAGLGLEDDGPSSLSNPPSNSGSLASPREPGE